MSETIFDAAEFGRRISKSEQWVKRQAYAKRIPHRRIGQSVAFTEQDFEDYLASVRHGPRLTTVDGFTQRSRKKASA